MIDLIVPLVAVSAIILWKPIYTTVRLVKESDPAKHAADVAALKAYFTALKAVVLP